MIKKPSDSGVFLADAIIGLAILGSFIPIVFQVISLSSHLANYSLSRTRLLGEVQVQLANLTIRPNLSVGSFSGILQQIPHTQWLLEVRQSWPNGTRGKITKYNIAYQITWPSGTRLQTMHFRTSVFRQVP